MLCETNAHCWHFFAEDTGYEQEQVRDPSAAGRCGAVITKGKREECQKKSVILTLMLKC